MTFPQQQSACVYSWLLTVRTLICMQVFVAIVSDIAMMLTGMAATWVAGPMKLVWGTISFVAFGVVLYYLYVMVSR